MTALDIGDKCRHAVVNTLATYMVCQRETQNIKCNEATHKIVEALDTMLLELKQLEIEERR